MPITKYPTFMDTLNLVCMTNVFGITIAACLCFYLSTCQTKFLACGICLNICIRCKSIFYKPVVKRVEPFEVRVLLGSPNKNNEHQDLESESKSTQDKSNFEANHILDSQLEYTHLEDADNVDEMNKNNKKWKKISERVLQISKVLAVIIFPTSILVLMKVFDLI